MSPDRDLTWVYEPNTNAVRWSDGRLQTFVTLTGEQYLRGEGVEARSPPGGAALALIACFNERERVARGEALVRGDQCGLVDETGDWSRGDD